MSDLSEQLQETIDVGYCKYPLHRASWQFIGGRLKPFRGLLVEPPRPVKWWKYKPKENGHIKEPDDGI